MHEEQKPTDIDSSSNPSPNASPMDFTSPYAPIVAHEVTPVRPLGITVIGVLTILGGIVGLLSGLMGIAQLLLAEKLSAMFIPSGTPMADTQMQFQQEMQAVTKSFLVPNLLMMVFGMVIAGFLLVGGIGLLRNQKRAVSLLSRLFLAMIFFEVCRSVLNAIVQWQMYPVMAKYMKQMASGNGQPGASGEMIAQMAMVGAVIGLVSWLIWSVAKIGLLWWGRRYLGRPLVREYFDAVASIDLRNRP